MGVEIQFPLELVVEAVPLSQGASADSLGAWRDQLRLAATSALPEGHWTTEEPVAITVYCFPGGRMRSDLDNILKPIIDAFSKLIYVDDRQVERIVAQKFEPERPVTFDNPSERLAEVMERNRPVLYIRLDNDLSRGG